MPFKFKNELSAVDNNHFLTDLGDGIKGLVDLNGKILFKAPFDWVFSHGNGIYSGNSYDSKDRNKIVGFADIYGNTTLTKEEYATMQRWNKQREEEERIAAEKRKAESEKRKASSATTVAFDGEEEVFITVEEPPRFPGGDSALYMYLCMNLSYPDAARENAVCQA